MPVLSGPELDKMADRLREWYFLNREKLIKRLEDKYPYGSVPLSAVEQVTRFQGLTPEDWQGLIIQLQSRYRGDPKAHDKVTSDLTSYVHSMLLHQSKAINLNAAPDVSSSSGYR